MNKKHFENGRSLLETLTVLVVIALLTIASIIGYNVVVDNYRSKETAKTVSELGLRYKMNPVKANESKKVEIKKVYPEANRASTDEVKLLDGGTASLTVFDGRRSFAVVVKDVEMASCEAILEAKAYDAFVQGDALSITSENVGTTSNLQGKMTLNRDSIKEACKESKPFSLVFGDDCVTGRQSYWYDGKCYSCPPGEQKDKNDVCCPDGNINSCGYCEADKAGNHYHYCTINNTECGGGFCAESVGICAECTPGHEGCCGKDENGHPKECSNYHCCPAGQVWTGSRCSCENESWSYCPTALSCCEHGCSETDPTKCKVPCTGSQPGECYKCDDTTGDWIVDDGKEIGSCGQCQADGSVGVKPGFDAECCNTTDGSIVADGTSTGDCTECQNGSVSVKSGYDAECCNTANGLFINGHVTGCKECSAGHATVYSDTCYECDNPSASNWGVRLKTGWRLGTGNVCCHNTSGNAGDVCSEDACCQSGHCINSACCENSKVYNEGGVDKCCTTGHVSLGHCCGSTQAWASASNTCCATGNISSAGKCCSGAVVMQGSQKVCLEDATCTIANGKTCTAGASAPNCCTSGNCTSGHCCPAGQVWNGTSCAAPVCNLANGQTCTAGASAPNCCTSGNCTNGHCCPAGQEWNGSQCCLDVGCGCNITKTSEGCCPGQVKGCDGVCGSGKVDVGCGCGVDKTSEGCCPGQVKGCDGVCGSGKVDAGCGCGQPCPTCSSSSEEKYSFDYRYSDRLVSGDKKVKTVTVPGEGACTYTATVRFECADDVGYVYVNSKKVYTQGFCGNNSLKCPASSLRARCSSKSFQVKGGDKIQIKVFGEVSPHEGLTAATGTIKLVPN